MNDPRRGTFLSFLLFLPHFCVDITTAADGVLRRSPTLFLSRHFTAHHNLWFFCTFLTPALRYYYPQNIWLLISIHCFDNGITVLIMMISTYFLLANRCSRRFSYDRRHPHSDHMMLLATHVLSLIAEKAEAEAESVVVFVSLDFSSAALNSLTPPQNRYRFGTTVGCERGEIPLATD